MEVTFNNLNAKIVVATNDELRKLRLLLTEYAPGYRFHPAFKAKKWDGKVSLLKDSKFPVGLLPRISEAFGSKLTCIDERYINTIQLNPHTVPLRDYQHEAVKAAYTNTFAGTWWPRGIVQIATGGGKTEVACAMLQSTQVPSLFIAPSTQLVDQTIDRLAKYGIEAGKIGDGSFDLSKRISVATVQTLMWHNSKTNKTAGREKENVATVRKKKAERRKKIEQFLSTIEQVFIDEAHLIVDDSTKRQMFISAIEAMPNAYMRWGLTATPFIREPLYNRVLEGAIGNELIKISNRDLISMGFAVDAEVDIYSVPQIAGVPNKWPECYNVGVVLSTKRNEIVKQAVSNETGPMLVLVKSVDHGNILQKMLPFNPPFIYGKTPVAERKRVAKGMEDETIDVVIASGVWYTGIDIPPIRTIVNAAGGESEVQQLQKLGRGLRLAKGKNMLKIVDFKDQASKTLIRHAKSRIKLYRNQGFKVVEK